MHVKSIGIKKVSKRQPTPKKNGGPTPLLSREDQVVVMLLTELAKRYSQDDQPISRLDSAAILRKVFEELLKRPIEKEYAEIEYYAMMSWRKIPPPSSLMRAMGAPKLAMESDMECMVRHLQDRLHDAQVRNAAHSLLRKLAV